MGAALLVWLPSTLPANKENAPVVIMAVFFNTRKAISVPFSSFGGVLSAAIEANSTGDGNFPAARAAPLPLTRTFFEPVSISPSGLLSPNKLSIPSATQSAASSINPPIVKPAASPAPAKMAAPAAVAIPPVPMVSATAAVPIAA